jgi:hypothetical protein
MTFRGDTVTETALLFGAIPHTYLDEWQITSEFALVERKLGVRIKQVPQQALMARYHGLHDGERAEAATLAEDLLAGATRDRRAKPVTDSDVERATRLYLAMRHYIGRTMQRRSPSIAGPFSGNRTCQRPAWPSLS